jgi:predicted DNA-binding protein
MNEARINARVGEATLRQMEELVRATGQTTSGVVREAIAVYHAQVRDARPVPKRLLAMVGKGRSRDGRTDVATNYKQVLAESLADKYKLGPKLNPLRKP